ncbi:MAG TPA: hypothetical protein VG388_11860, partial [Solirubrobacteraceae bacterium]|nr:hypothetical protein [Solirubrobacteraceae bacterium]
PQISHVNFQDDSFMAIPYPQLEEFAELWKAELDIPFAVYGVIPNYVKEDKFAILTWAGMNRVRMGIQSGSQEILDFYQRPSPPEKILAAGEVIGSFAPKYHLPPVYDIIMDNPIETRENVVETLQLLYDMPRPFTLLIYSLKVIPNTELERAMKERGVELEKIDSSYLVIPPRAANLLLYLLCILKPPGWMWRRLLKLARASSEEQKLYPRLGMLLRLLYLVRRVIPHAKRLDFSITPGWAGYWSWRLGLVDLWHRRFNPRLPKPPPPARRRAPARPVLTLVPERPVAPGAPEPARSAAADDAAR